jgi:hemolysin D
MVNLKVKPDSFNSELPPENNQNEQHNIRILIADDQSSIRQMLYLSLKSESDFKIISRAANGQSAIAQIEAFHPDVALIDIEMPLMDGISATQIVKERFVNTKVIILSSCDDEEYIHKAFKAGAKGYLLKTTPIEEIASAIRYVQKGYLQLEPGIFEKYSSEKSGRQFNKIEQNQSHKYHKTQAQNLDKNSQIIDFKPKKSLLLESAPDIQPHIQENSQPTNSLAKTRLLRSNNNEWSSVTKESIETLPQVWTRGLLYFLMVLVGIILPWAMLSQVDETGSAKGKLEPQGKVFTVDAPVAGTIAKVFVKEGQLVKSQEPLLSLESEPVESELQQVQTKLASLQKELAQLKLLKNQLLLTVNTQRQQNAAQLFEKQAQVDQARQNIQHSLSAQKLAETAYDEAKKEVQRYLKAKKQGIVSEIQVVEKEGSVREQERLLEQADSDTEQAQLRFQEQEKGYLSLIHSGEIAVFKSEEQLKELEKQIDSLKFQIKENQSQISALKYQLGQRIVKAPVSGSIFQLPAQETGTVLEPGGLVAEIAPQQSSLILKAQMIPTESGSLDLGMPVKLKFDAYPFQDYGIVEGKLTKISPTTKAIDTEQGRVESYELEVKLDQNYIQAKNKRVALRPGQTATAEVIVRQRRLIDFALEPFKKLQKDGLEL